MPMKIGVGVGTEKDPLQAIQTASRLAKANMESEKIDLAIVFSTAEFSHPALFKTISGLLGSANIIGSSSPAIISSQGIFKHGIIIMLLSLPESVYFNTAYVKEISKKSATDAGEELGEKLLYGFTNISRDLSIIFSDAIMKDNFNFLYGLQERMGRSFPLAGASVTDNFEFKKTHVYFNEEVFSDSACGILWGGKLNFGLGIKHGWKPLGRLRQVTGSRGCTVYSIDGAPAVEFYREYLAYDFAQLKRELKRISILYPIGICLEGEGEYLLRNILSIEDEGSLVFQGNVPQGSMVRLMIGTKESCLEATKQVTEEVKKGLSGRPCNFVLVFDSASRYILLGRQADKELKIIKEGFGKDIPIIGIYTYGEQAPLKAINYQGRAYFHNQSIAILGMGG